MGIRPVISRDIDALRTRYLGSVLTEIKALASRIHLLDAIYTNLDAILDANLRIDDALSAASDAEAALIATEIARDLATAAQLTAETCRDNAEASSIAAEASRLAAELAQAAAELARDQAQAARDSALTIEADVIAQGDTQVARVIAEGDTQDARVTNKGDLKWTAVRNEGIAQQANVVAEGDTQVARVITEGDVATAAKDAAVIAQGLAEGSATAAGISESNAHDSEVAAAVSESNALTYKNDAETAASNASDNADATAADKVSAGNYAASASIYASNAADSAEAADSDAIATAADRVQTGLDRVAVSNDKNTVLSNALTVANDKDIVAADKATTITAKDDAETAASNAASSEANALTYKNDAESAKTASEIAQAIVEGIQATVEVIETDVVNQGDTQVARVFAEGDTQETRVTNEGTAAVAAIQADVATAESHKNAAASSATAASGFADDAEQSKVDAQTIIDTFNPLDHPEMVGPQGPQGIQGPAGSDGSDAEVTETNIRAAIPGLKNSVAGSVVDANDETLTSGWYHCTTNNPMGADCALLVIRYNDSYTTQLAIDWRTDKSKVRGRNNGTWGTWRDCSINDSFTPNTATHLQTTDLDTILTPGFYYQTGNINTPGNNYPVELAGSLLVQKASSGVTQTYFTFNNTGVYVRAKYSTNDWYPWKQFALHGDEISTTRVKTSNGTEVALCAGESYNYVEPLGTSESVYSISESGFQIFSSPDNWASGWAGKRKAWLCKSDGTSYFPGDIGIENTSLRGDTTDGSLYVDTGNGYLRMGPRNTSWCHMDTDRGQFYFYKPLNGPDGPYLNAGDLYRGSNSNGYYIRFPDGTQICIHQKNSSSSGYVTWTFPAAFSSTTNLTGMVSGNTTGNNNTQNCQILGTTSLQFDSRADSGSRGSMLCGLYAIGRWK